MQAQLRQQVAACEAVILDDEIVFAVIGPACGGVRLRHRQMLPIGRTQVVIPRRATQSSQSLGPRIAD